MIPTFGSFVDIDKMWVHNNSAVVVIKYLIDSKPNTKASHYYYILIQTFFILFGYLNHISISSLTNYDV